VTQWIAGRRAADKEDRMKREGKKTSKMRAECTKKRKKKEKIAGCWSVHIVASSSQGEL